MQFYVINFFCIIKFALPILVFFISYADTNEAAEKINLDTEQETNDTDEEAADEDGTSYSGESDEADDDF